MTVEKVYHRSTLAQHVLKIEIFSKYFKYSKVERKDI